MQFYLFYYGIQAVGGIIECGVFAMSFAHAKLPGFDRFLLAPSEDELKTAADCGPIIIINVSDYRCDALIIEKSQLRTLGLPRLYKRYSGYYNKDSG
jgi:hypothetical protein